MRDNSSSASLGTRLQQAVSLGSLTLNDLNSSQRSRCRSLKRGMFAAKNAWQTLSVRSDEDGMKVCTDAEGGVRLILCFADSLWEFIKCVRVAVTCLLHSLHHKSPRGLRQNSEGYLSTHSCSYELGGAVFLGILAYMSR